MIGTVFSFEGPGFSLALSGVCGMINTVQIEAPRSDSLLWPSLDGVGLPSPGAVALLGAGACKVVTLPGSPFTRPKRGWPRNGGEPRRIAAVSFSSERRDVSMNMQSKVYLIRSKRRRGYGANDAAATEQTTPRLRSKRHRGYGANDTAAIRRGSLPLRDRNPYAVGGSWGVCMSGPTGYHGEAGTRRQFEWNVRGVCRQ